MNPIRDPNIPDFFYKLGITTPEEAYEYAQRAEERAKTAEAAFKALQALPNKDDDDYDANFKAARIAAESNRKLADEAGRTAQVMQDTEFARRLEEATLSLPPSSYPSATLCVQDAPPLTSGVHDKVAYATKLKPLSNLSDLIEWTGELSQTYPLDFQIYSSAVLQGMDITIEEMLITNSPEKFKSFMFTLIAMKLSDSFGEMKAAHTVANMISDKKDREELLHELSSKQPPETAPIVNQSSRVESLQVRAGEILSLVDGGQMKYMQNFASHSPLEASLFLPFLMEKLPKKLKADIQNLSLSEQLEACMQILFVSNTESFKNSMLECIVAILASHNAPDVAFTLANSISDSKQRMTILSKLEARFGIVNTAPAAAAAAASAAPVVPLATLATSTTPTFVSVGDDGYSKILALLKSIEGKKHSDFDQANRTCGEAFKIAKAMLPGLAKWDALIQISSFLTQYMKYPNAIKVLNQIGIENFEDKQFKMLGIWTIFINLVFNKQFKDIDSYIKNINAYMKNKDSDLDLSVGDWYKDLDVELLRALILSSEATISSERLGFWQNWLSYIDRVKDIPNFFERAMQGTLTEIDLLTFEMIFMS